ncbi:MAG: pyridoxal 5'-phosphate synthase lyase subunit PdxS [Candidatus Bathyarchaeia archaeon]
MELISRSEPVASPIRGTVIVKRGFAQMQKGGVIMDVTNVEQAQIAEEAGAVAVMALDKLPADVRKAGGVARMCDIRVIQDVIDHVTIPIMAKCRIGHHMEARVLQQIGVDMIDESEVLTPADSHHIDKWQFTVPFVNGARDLGEGLRRISEGASMIRTKGEPGTGNVAEAVKHLKLVMDKIRELRNANDEQLLDLSRVYKVPFEIVKETAVIGRLPVVNFSAGGVATPADAAFMMWLGADGVFVGSGVFKSEDPMERARSIVLSVTHWDDPQTVVEASKMITEKKSMSGLDIKSLKPEELMQTRST